MGGRGRRERRRVRSQTIEGKVEAKGRRKEEKENKKKEVGRRGEEERGRSKRGKESLVLVTPHTNDGEMECMK